MDDANTNRIYDYKDIDWAENRSKSLHDPLLMANVKDGKKKNDFVSSSKTVPKTPKKMDYELCYQANPYTHYLKFGVAYNNDFVQDLKKYMNVEAFELFTNSIFVLFQQISTIH
ncbi:hypothetical protein H5410_000382 [Solanum commersonii]|uniref:Uncharacterized protein n=1 Tax=Solanum commersonii TaxID=4109 RepID=A0A9J6AWC8_SOLCO|nr:hypothetical protein H5410_000382 [Solanum commersonii]